jgi:3',5'-cyclic AMP phosphodiesterase CpdA
MLRKTNGKRITMKIMHLSDLHLCAQHKPENIVKIEQLLKHAARMDTDHLVITGDISHNAQEDDFTCLRELLGKYNFLSQEKATMVIGNHDIYGGVYYAMDVIKFPAKCLNTDFSEKVNIFVHYFRELFRDTLQLNDSDPFPFVKILDNVLLLGINSIAPYSKLKNPMASNGFLSVADQEKINRCLKNGAHNDKIKIAVMHHHFKFNASIAADYNNRLLNFIEKHSLKLYGKKKVLKLFHKNNINLVLHGHIHSNNRYQVNAIDCMNGGGAIDDYMPDRPKYNLIITDGHHYQISRQYLPAEAETLFPTYSDAPLIPAIAG